MPKVTGFTEKQKQEHNLEKRRQQIIRGINAYKCVEEKTGKELGKELGMCEGTVLKLLHGGDVNLSIYQWLHIVSLAGMEVQRVD